MEKRKNLCQRTHENQADDEMTMPPESEEPPADLLPEVYITDDLTQRKARLAFLARNLKRNKLISDTWTMDCKILIKNLYGRIRQVNHESDLAEYDTTQRNQPEWQK